MTKKAILEVITSVIPASMVGKPLTQETYDKLLGAFASKGGGFAKRNIDELIKVENGKTVAILDTVANVWLPATKEFFYEDKSNKADPKLNGLKNHSKAREKLVKEIQGFKNTLKNLMWDGRVKAKKLSEEELNSLSIKLPKVNYERIVPFGQPNAGTIKPDADVEKYTKALVRAKAKVYSEVKATEPKAAK